MGAAAGRAVRATAAAREPERLRVAVTRQRRRSTCRSSPTRAQAARDAGALLESLGHDVEEADPPWREPRLGRAFTALFGPLVTSQIAPRRG